jgi:hypothetical protein
MQHHAPGSPPLLHLQDDETLIDGVCANPLVRWLHSLLSLKAQPVLGQFVGWSYGSHQGNQLDPAPSQERGCTGGEVPACRGAVNSGVRDITWPEHSATVLR